MKLVPLFDKVVLEKEKMEETTKSGIVLPGQDDKEKPGQAVVVAVGPGGVVDGKEIKLQVRKGSMSCFPVTPERKWSWKARSIRL